jgi:hypothetical protein
MQTPVSFAVIASGAKQSIFHAASTKKMDCFAALAMTAMS